MKHILHLIFISLFSFQLSAQVSLVLSSSAASALGSKDEASIIAKSTVKNESDSKKTIVWERTVHSISEGWETAVCDKNVCYNTNIDSFDFELDPGEEGTLNVYGYPNGVEGMVSVSVKLTDAADPNNTVTGQFDVQSDGFTTSTTFVPVQDIKIYPNPTAQFISLMDAQDVAGLSLYNIVGRQVKSFTATYENQYDVSSLPVGLYLVRVMDKNLNTLKTLRLKINYP